MNKHRTLKAAFAAVLAAFMALAVFPVSALPAIEAEKSPVAPYWTVPEGYNAHDYNKCVQFLEQEDENGIKNGQKLNPDYDPNDPETWVVGRFDMFDSDEINAYFDRGYYNSVGDYYWDFPHSWLVSETITIGIEWDTETEYSSDGLMHVQSIIIPPIYKLYEKIDGENPYLNYEESDWDIAGSMDFSGMERLFTFIVQEIYGVHGYHYGEAINSIDLSNCEMLTTLCCIRCSITELDISGDQYIQWLACNLSGIEGGLDLSAKEGDEPCMEYLNITGMALTSFDFPNIGIHHLECGYNPFESLDLSNLLYLDYFDCGFDYPYDDLGNSYNGLKELKYCGRTCRVEGEGSIMDVTYIYDVYEEYWEYDSILVSGNSFAGWFDENGNLLSKNGWFDFDEGATGVFIAKFVSDDEPVSGDLDGDGEVSAADALELMRYLVGESDGNSINLEFADVNGDGEINLMDALLVLRMALGGA